MLIYYCLYRLSRGNMKVIRIDDSAHKILVQRKEQIIKAKKAEGIERPRANHSEVIRAMNNEIIKLRSLHKTT